ncbi:hypothetical protein [Falsiphaeobacter marinintestinus]|uniref:hypothetical protein n=1 Tax=Falsiphaeobacter marinintestinus TaxID=1492905 RepID=UPI0011B42459|nr:hypothetical protein [Phaeobacter marinintestinus]
MRYLVLVSILVASSCSVTDQLFQTDTATKPSQADATLEDASLTQETTDLDDTNADIDPGTDAATDTGQDSVPAQSAGPKSTVAALGDPTKPGLWLETPLVSDQRSGRITLAATGKSAEVTLIPIEGEDTAGSRLSLQGFQALGAPLTELIDLTVQPL